MKPQINTEGELHYKQNEVEILLLTVSSPLTFISLGGPHISAYGLIERGDRSRGSLRAPLS